MSFLESLANRRSIYALGDAVDVELITLAPSTPIQYFKDALTPRDTLTPLAKAELAASNVTINDTTRALLGNIIYKFSRVMHKSLSGSGCAQMANIYLNQNDIPEVKFVC